MMPKKKQLYPLFLAFAMACDGNDGGAPERPAPTLYNRTEAPVCSQDPRPLPPEPDLAGGECPLETSECQAHADCDAGPNGQCVGKDECYTGCCACRYDACSQDEECGDAGLCACAGAAPFENYWNNTCIPKYWGVECTNASQCDSGYCLANRAGCAPAALPADTGASLYAPVGVIGFYCASEEDECRGDQECPDGSWCFQGEEDRFVCDDDPPWCEGE